MPSFPDPTAGARGPWRLLVHVRDPADPLWLLAEVAGPEHVLPGEDLGAGDAAAWVAGLTGGPVTLHLASATVWRVDPADLGRDGPTVVGD